MYTLYTVFRRAYWLLPRLVMLLAACTTPQPDAGSEQDPEVAAEVASEPTDAPPPTDVPPTPIPPTETPVPQPPIVIDDTQTAADGCTPVTLNTASWGPIYAGYTSGADPFFQLHDNEDSFYFNVELYTVYGAGWTGQPGTFAPDCNANGICVYLVPDDVNAYLATAGEVNVVSLAEEGGAISGPVDVTLTNLTLQPVPGSGSQGCFHVDEVSLAAE